MRQMHIQFVLAGAVLAGAALAQAQQPAPLPAFEVAGVKPNVDGPGKMQTVTRPGGVYVAVNVPLRLLIADAYIGNQPGAVDRVVGGPAWVQSVLRHHRESGAGVSPHPAGPARGDAADGSGVARRSLQAQGPPRAP